MMRIAKLNRGLRMFLFLLVFYNSFAIEGRTETASQPLDNAACIRLARAQRTHFLKSRAQVVSTARELTEGNVRSLKLLASTLTMEEFRAIIPVLQSISEVTDRIRSDNLDQKSALSAMHSAAHEQTERMRQQTYLEINAAETKALNSSFLEMAWNTLSGFQGVTVELPSATALPKLLDFAKINSVQNCDLKMNLSPRIKHFLTRVKRSEFLLDALLNSNENTPWGCPLGPLNSFTPLESRDLVLNTIPGEAPSIRACSMKRIDVSRTSDNPFKIKEEVLDIDGDQNTYVPVFACSRLILSDRGLTIVNIDPEEAISDPMALEYYRGKAAVPYRDKERFDKPKYLEDDAEFVWPRLPDECHAILNKKSKMIPLPGETPREFFGAISVDDSNHNTKDLPTTEAEDSRSIGNALRYGSRIIE